MLATVIRMNRHIFRRTCLFVRWCSVVPEITQQHTTYTRICLSSKMNRFHLAHTYWAVIFSSTNSLPPDLIPIMILRFRLWSLEQRGRRLVLRGAESRKDVPNMTIVGGYRLCLAKNGSTQCQAPVKFAEEPVIHYVVRYSTSRGRPPSSGF